MEIEDFSHLSRFIEAQQEVYQTALKELQNGRKQTHWMWFIFPQLSALGKSSTALYYGICGMDEARAYLRQSLLRERLEGCVEAVLKSGESNPKELFGFPDHLKFHSSLTLFAKADPENKLFKDALEKFYHGLNDQETEKILTNHQI